MERLEQLGDHAAVEVLEIILHDEVGHVEIGSHWFRFLCSERGMEPEATFRCLLEEYMKGIGKGPLHRSARLAAGFSEAELNYLEGMG